MTKFAEQLKKQTKDARNKKTAKKVHAKKQESKKAQNRADEQLALDTKNAIKWCKEAAKKGDDSIFINRAWHGNHINSLNEEKVSEVLRAKGLKVNSGFQPYYSDGDCGTLWEDHYYLIVSW